MGLGLGMRQACRCTMKPTVALIIVLISVLNPPQALRADEELPPQIIVHHGVELPSNFSTSTLRAIFSGRMQRWPNGTRIKAFVLPQDHPDHQSCCRTVLHTFPYVLQQQWDQQTFTGSGIPPVEIATTYQLHRAVSHTPGAIGYGRLNNTSGDWIQFVGGETAQEMPGVSTF